MIDFVHFAGEAGRGKERKYLQAFRTEVSNIGRHNWAVVQVLLAAVNQGFFQIFATVSASLAWTRFHWTWPGEKTKKETKGSFKKG